MDYEKKYKEDYVSFETAKLLKEKGFDIPCREHYYQDGGLSPYSTEYNNWNGEEDYYSRPTLQMARKWLREDKNVDIEISVYSKGFDGTLTYCADILTYGSRLIMEQPIINATYEQTCEKAIQYALKFDLKQNNYVSTHLPM